MIIWGLGALHSKHKSSKIFIDFIVLCQDELELLFNDENISTVGPLKCFIIEALYQTFHFEWPDIGGIIDKTEFVSLFKCNCGHRITFVHTNYMDGKCTNTNCGITYEEKHSFNFDINNPILKGGSVNSETPNPHVLALLPNNNKSCYEPYVFTPNEYNIIRKPKDSEIKLNSDGVKKFNDKNHKRKELIGVISNLKMKSEDYKNAFNKVLINLRNIVLDTWQKMHDLINNGEDIRIFETYRTHAIKKWTNDVEYKLHFNAEPLIVPLNYDGFLQALDHKLNMGKTVPTSTSSPPPPPPPPPPVPPINKKRKADEMTENVPKIDDRMKEQTPETNNNHKSEIHIQKKNRFRRLGRVTQSKKEE